MQVSGGGGGGGGVWDMERLQAEEMEHPSSNLVNDGVILPHETREVSYTPHKVSNQLEAVHFSICFVCLFSLYLFVFLYLFVCLFSLCLFVFSLLVCFLSTCLFVFYLFVCFLSICLFVCFLQVLSQCLDVCLRFPEPQVHTRSRHRLNVLRM